ncbi:MAG: FtsX-like permease family protein, partial [Acidimicrobiales bacterium]
MTLIKLAFRNISSRPGRFLLTSLAVLVGVSLTSAVFIFTDSLRSTFGALSQDIESGYDLAVRSEIPFGDRSAAAPVDPAVTELLTEVDGVISVQPRVFEIGIVPNTAEGEAATARGPNIGVNWEDQAAVPRLFLSEGRAPAATGEFALDVDAAAEDDFVVGDVYGIQTPKGIIEAELVGTFSFADPENNALVGAKLVAFDTGTALDLFKDGRGYNDVTLTLGAGGDAASVSDAVAAIIPAGLEVLGRDQIVDETAEDFNEFIDIFRTILLVFAFVILLVAAFVIYNVFSIIVGQRIQEIGLLRALGATGTQVTQSIAIEAFMVGLFATVVGLLLGIPIAAGLQALLSALEFGPDESSTPVRLTTVVVAAVLGIGLTMTAAIWPALRARGVSPMAALRQGVSLTAHVQPRPVLGWVLTSTGALLLGLGFALDDYLLLLILSILSGILFFLGVSRINVAVGRFALIGLAVVLVTIALTANLRASMLLALLGSAALNAFLGMNAISPLFATRAARILGAPIARLGVPGKLARENAGRNPRRTATAASALMIGLALVTTVAVIAESFKATFADVLANAVTADWIIVGPDGAGDGTFSPAVAAGLDELPEIAAVLPVQWVNDAFRTTVDQDVRTVYATNLADMEDHFDPDIVTKDESLYSPSAVLIHDDVADDLDVGVGD